MPKRKGARWNKVYGLPAGAESTEEEVQDLSVESENLASSFVDDLHGTSKSLQSLLQHRDFSRWLKTRNLSSDYLAEVHRKLVVYKDLRHLDPGGFRRLIDEPSHHSCNDSCSAWQYISHYVMNSLLTVLLCTLIMIASSQPARLLAAALVLVNACYWSHSTSLFGARQGLWFEDCRVGHKVPARTALLLNVFEVLYVMVTFGLGGIVSLGLCLLSSSHQTLFERLCNAKLICEHEAPVEIGQSVIFQPSEKVQEDHSADKSALSGSVPETTKSRLRRKRLEI